jgi:hypothetical protein
MQRKGKYMKNMIITVAALLISGFASAQSVGIEGSWGTQQAQNGINFDVTFAINQNSTTITNVCSGFGTSAVAQITVASSYDGHNLNIFEARELTTSNGPLNCNVSARPDQMHYVVQGGFLILSHDGSPEQMVLTRK